MRAAIFSEHGDPSVIRIAEVPTPEPGPGEVRLRVEASSLNHLDLWVRRGLPIEIAMPHIGGSDVAGVVESVGPGEDTDLLGTRVVVDPSLGYEWYQGEPRGEAFRDAPLRLIGEHENGGFAEYVVVPTANLLQSPDHVSAVSAAAAGLVSVTAWRGLLTRGGLKAGETVLITGASGGVGSTAVQIARYAGAEVHAITSGPANCERVRELGAHHVYDRVALREASSLGSAISDATSGRGVDLVLDSVGEVMWEVALSALRVRGRIVSYGATTGAKVSIDLRHLFWKQLSIVGTTMGSRAEFRAAMRLVFDGIIEPVVAEVLTLDRTREAHERLEGGGVFGKIVIVP